MMLWTIQSKSGFLKLLAYRLLNFVIHINSKMLPSVQQRPFHKVSQLLLSLRPDAALLRQRRIQGGIFLTIRIIICARCGVSRLQNWRNDWRDLSYCLKDQRIAQNPERWSSITNVDLWTLIYGYSHRRSRLCLQAQWLESILKTWKAHLGFSSNPYTILYILTRQRQLQTNGSRTIS